MSIIYEVNLSVQNTHAERFAAWLRPHMEEMCSFDGFIGSKWYIDHERCTASETAWTIHYVLVDVSFYERYCNEHADRMRQEGIDLFSGVFTANRRILHLKNDN